MNRRWICNDVCMDILPFFDRVQLGLKLALISPRFDGLVDTHFDSGKYELEISNQIIIRKDTDDDDEKPICVRDEDEIAQFPLPDRPLPKKIRFRRLMIEYIDHYVIEFLRSNQQIFDKGIHLNLYLHPSHDLDQQPIWDVFAREIWPTFAQNIRHLQFSDTNHLDNLRHLTSPTILSDVNPNSIHSGELVPELLGDDGPNASAGQALGKWLHTPRTDGQPKRLFCCFSGHDAANGWLNNFKQTFLRATNSSAGYIIDFILDSPTPQIVPFELTNEATQEMLTLEKERNSNVNCLKRRSIGKTGGDVNLNALNIVIFELSGPNCIGPLSPPAAKSGARAAPPSPKARRAKAPSPLLASNRRKSLRCACACADPVAQCRDVHWTPFICSLAERALKMGARSSTRCGRWLTHKSKRMKPELRCHAVLCRRADEPQQMHQTLRRHLQSALQEYRREKAFVERTRHRRNSVDATAQGRSVGKHFISCARKCANKTIENYAT
ncbi:hypothetical protein niasHT_038163 [Heterodera trifolii]|uniref:PID domain-containing protein n=1 Tax=Heterodera trifolii TaxID=157864 RepID=A0ABD2IA23_9BILA